MRSPRARSIDSRGDRAGGFAAGRPEARQARAQGTERARAVPRIKRGGPRGGAPRLCHAPGGGVACVRGTQRGEVERPAEKGRRVAGGGQTEAARDRGEGGEAGGTGQFSREGEGRRRAGLARHPRDRHARDDSVVRDRRGTQGGTRVAHPALEGVEGRSRSAENNDIERRR